jgi:hypothetical protein
VWPIVEGNNAYKDIVVWLKANRCPCIYAKTVKTVNAFEVFGLGAASSYEGGWKDGFLSTTSFSDKGKFTYDNGEMETLLRPLYFLGCCLLSYGRGKFTSANG